ncbi:hypothetical protein P152DRAFT_462340 [Eremomyces bilateralis CBS 781.70]|uniref:S-adenosyl-L-methionine-dependent methyltransferase n=1 Tax=Eremomyces bilateralis CBS 781.70 TaxID=1392243 RepID=A0A6G1FSA5_9PEZI|nr:uncharacterized protein P152DRAFT_462340 [Eremomyces bilateralis CBS 781.70]KAF1808616.1 hypothetical protein P152DRAFT_462340 [Eremomyces bilateralis CBS 781.70]
MSSILQSKWTPRIIISFGLHLAYGTLLHTTVSLHEPMSFTAQSALPSPYVSSSLTTTHRSTFYEVAAKHNTDKVTADHFEFMYQKHLPALHSRLRHCRRIKMLEISLGCGMDCGPGASYHTWLDYFGGPQHVDLYYLGYDAACAEKWAHEITGATIFTGDHADVSVLNKMVQESGGAFDVIVDDGGHAMAQQITSLGLL